MKYPMCTVASVINPGKYCMVSIDKEHVSEVKNIEERMESSMVFEDTSEFQLNPQMCVAVTDSEGKFRRAIIEKKIRNNIYQVLLIDYGRVTTVGRTQIKVITNKLFLQVEPLAFVVRLYGLIPTERVTIEGVVKAKAVKDWTQESSEFVRNVFENNPHVVVQNILIQRRIVYGDLFVRLNPNPKFVSLRKLLCKNGFCSFSESNFVRLEKLIASNYDAELENKMEFVEKWQRENFGSTPRRTYELPTPILSRDSETDVTSLQASNSKLSADSSNRQENHTSDGNENSLETSSEPKKVGSGRGKFKTVLQQMKSRESSTSNESDKLSAQDNSYKGLETTSKGRGKLLNKYVELKKMRELGISQLDFSPLGADSVKNGSGKTSEEGKPMVQEKYSTRIEKAVVKPGEYSEFEDSNELTEVSLSFEDEGPPPLVRNSPSDEQFKESVLKDGEVSSPKRNGETPNSATEERSFPSEEFKRLGSPEAAGTCDKLVWGQFKSNLMALSSCWSPYIVFHDSFVEPVNTFRELPIQPSIIKNLEAGGKFNNLSQVQRWAIPAIRKQHNIVVIGSPKTGKTLSYLVPLIDYIQDESYFDELPQGNGPAVVIVASSSRVCESIYYMCHSLLGNITKNKADFSKVQVILAHGGGCEKQVWVNLTNGCDILIATPHCLVRLLETPILTNFERLTCLVLDEIDVISQNPFRKSVRIILEKAQFSTRERHYQKIFCGEKWTKNVESLVKTFVKSFAVVICSYCEAVIFEGLKPSIFLVDRERKFDFFLDKIRDQIGVSKILVVCEKMSEAFSLNEFLTEKDFPSLLAHENILADKLRVLETIWKASRDTVLIVTDGVLSEMNIREAQTLVHYGLPVKSKTNFFLRYSTLENFLRDKGTCCHFQERNNKTKPQVIILVDDENHYQLPHIVDFVIRLGGKVTAKILETCENIRRLIEVNKRNSPICENLVSFGRCRNTRECSQRHAFVKSRDSPGNLPTSGWVNFEIIKAHDASRLSVRLTEHVQENETTTKFPERDLTLDAKLAEYFEIDSNRRFVGMPKVGIVCAVMKEEEEKEVFYRATIIEYLKLDKHEHPLEVSVKLMDVGDVLSRKTTELYELPENLSTCSPTAVDVIVVGVQPMDFDLSWSQTASNLTKDLVSRELEENQYWSGKIVLSLNNVLFLEPVKRKQFLPHLNIHVFDLILQDELLNNRIAVANADHLPSLRKLAVEGDLETPKKEESKKDLSVVQPQWAFFDSDIVRVRFLAAESTTIVYLQPKKFQDLLEDLEKDCQKATNELKARTLKKPPSLSVGMFCLALFEDGKWNRGRIETENENQFQVFFVDHGDFLFLPKTDVLPIPQALLLRLPCQAIECSLVATEPNSSTDALQEIYSFSNDGTEDLYACVVKKDLKPSVTNGRKYCVNLVDLKGVSLSKILVDAGLARLKESEEVHLENFEIPEEEEEEKEEEEKEEEEKEEEEKEEEEEEKEEEEKIEQEENEDMDVVSSVVDVSDTQCDYELKDYFDNLKDDVFEDDVALEFLKEFASKLFPAVTPVKDTNSLIEKETAKEISPVASPTDVMPRTGTLNIEKLLELHRKRRSKHKKELSFKSRENVLTPQAVWCQNQMEVQVKILLGNVVDYSLECTATNVSFRCFLEEKFYAVDLKLFGAINPNLTRVAVKAFHVLLVMAKLSFCVWPRLHFDEGKHRWISLDVESLTDRENFFLERIKLAKREIESGMIKKGYKSSEIRPCSDSELSDEWIDESDTEDDEGDDV